MHQPILPNPTGALTSRHDSLPETGELLSDAAPVIPTLWQGSCYHGAGRLRQRTFRNRKDFFGNRIEFRAKVLIKL